MRRVVVAGAVLGMLGLTLLASRPAPAFDEAADGKRPLSVHHLREYMTKPHSDGIKAGLEAGPADERAWRKLVVHAAMVNESAHMLLQGDRNVDETWTEAAEAMRDGTVQLIEKLKAQDQEGSQETYLAMKQASCAVCHAKHKKD